MPNSASFAVEDGGLKTLIYWGGKLFPPAVLPNNANQRDRPSRFLAWDFNACGVASGALLAALGRFVGNENRKGSRSGFGGLAGRSSP